MLVAAGLAEDGRGAAALDRGFFHLPGAEEDAVEPGVLFGLLGGGEQGRIAAGLTGKGHQVLRYGAQIADGAHPLRAFAFARGHGLGGAGRQLGQDEQQSERETATRAGAEAGGEGLHGVSLHLGPVDANFTNNFHE